jgi:flagellin
MGFGIKRNLSSIQVQRSVGLTTDRLNQSFQRLASGLRINRSTDDAAGLAIAESLRGDARIASVSIRNANDGMSIIAITDGAVGQITQVLSRLIELSEQSANGAYSNVQRSALQNEFSALVSEIERVAHTTTFNGQQLLSGGGELAFQVGFDGTSLSQITYSGIQATLAGLGLAEAGSSVSKYSIIGNTTEEAQLAAQFAIDALKAAVTSVTRNRGTLGAAESRLQTTIRDLAVARENFQASEAGIRDIDVAAESAEMARNQVLQQAGTAVLAQANLQPRLVLELLRD